MSHDFATMTSDNKFKSVIFLKDSFVLDESEEELIESCSENEIMVLTYSEIGNKRRDVLSIRGEMSEHTDFMEIGPFDDIVGELYELNRNQGLRIDISNASPYHATRLVPFSYLKRNIITIQKGTGIEEIEQKYLDYSSLSTSEYELVISIIEQMKNRPDGVDANDIECDWVSRNKRTKTVSGNYEHHPNHKKTIYRCMKKLEEDGFITNRGGRPKRYILDGNQLLMHEITKQTNIQDNDREQHRETVSGSGEDSEPLS